MTRLFFRSALLLVTLLFAMAKQALAQSEPKMISWMAVPPIVQQTIMQNVGEGNRMDKVYYVTDAAGVITYQALLKKGDGSTATLEISPNGRLAGKDAEDTTTSSASSKPRIAIPFDEGNNAYMQHDYERALKVLTPWAQQGDVRAQTILGTLYKNGYGTDADDGEARKWFKLAAQQGNENAQYNMGIMCYNGDGGEQDDVEAYMWFSLSAKSGNKSAAKQMKTLVRKMSPDAVKEAQAHAAEFKPGAAKDDN